MIVSKMYVQTIFILEIEMCLNNVLYNILCIQYIKVMINAVFIIFTIIIYFIIKSLAKTQLRS